MADQIIVKNIVKFLNSLTLNGCTNFMGINVKIIQIKITITLIYKWVPKMKKYNKVFRLFSNSIAPFF